VIGPAPDSSNLKRFVRTHTPSLSRNEVAPFNYSRFGEVLLEQKSNPTVLVVGGGTVGQGLEKLMADSRIEFVETDVNFGPRVQLICDAHDLPFADETFDGVIIQAVLEHVADPARCANEVHRVLKTGGVVYAETPFMQQVHGGPYDFTRFTHLGHRRLFRGFHEVASGPVGGPGMALAWSYRYFLKSWTTNQLAQGILELIARFTGFWLKYFDRYLMRKTTAFDNGWAYYFLGTKAEEALSDRDLVKLYRGAQ
jgi:ubiquinone/menaquinone biosynthesis C-methylase UbiE